MENKRVIWELMWGPSLELYVIFAYSLWKFLDRDFNKFLNSKKICDLKMGNTYIRVTDVNFKLFYAK